MIIVPDSPMPKSLKDVLTWMTEQHQRQIFLSIIDQSHDTLGMVSLAHLEIEERAKEFNEWKKDEALVLEILDAANDRNRENLRGYVSFSYPPMWKTLQEKGFLLPEEYSMLKIAVPPRFFETEGLSPASMGSKFSFDFKEMVTFQNAIRWHAKTQKRLARNVRLRESRGKSLSPKRSRD